MRIVDAKQLYQDALETAEVSCQGEADVLLSDVLSCEVSVLYADADRALTSDEQASWEQAVARRVAEEPLAYVVGTQGFWEDQFRVTPDTLIPRPETECLVEWVVQHYARHAGLSVLDLGTGAGAIILSMARALQDATLMATDLSENALEIAKDNALRLSIEGVEWRHGHWFDAVPKRRCFDIIVSNPPYVAASEMTRALSYEPVGALVSGESGFEALSQIVTNAPSFLKPGGVLVLEHGSTQAEVVMTSCRLQGFQSVESHSDLAGHPRFVTARWKE